ncbi:hypothetical protein [Streptomyces sp. NPDC059165]|uniref:hypothetical protein n=1 Tax=Streptomyces sp. NPDC059165 TaxID=3346751 RepID=UPI003678A5A9
MSRQLGRRGAILLCYGLVWALYGYGQIVQPQEDPRGLRPLLELAPAAAWGWCWVAAGLVAIVSAFMREGADWPGFLALPVVVLPWCVSYLAAWVLGQFDRGWIGALVWGAIAVPVLVVAGWRETPRPKRIELK